MRKTEIVYTAKIKDRFIIVCPQCGHETRANPYVLAHTHVDLAGKCSGCLANLKIKKNTIG